ncbi:MAG: flagellar hook basal-body protein [Desulfuromusa sp.]|jgi:flagellar basal body rod protein FlgG|nr:flagellar hook basal-body protein [Desulfuromusa sp.]
MSSGKYGAVAGMVSRMDMMENITAHLAAAKTFSYKKGVSTFEARLSEANSGMATKGINYVRKTKETIDFTPGEIEYSGNPLHVAINGEGFFKVLHPDDSVAYTRKGAFRMTPDGFLVDAFGMKVVNVENEPIIIPDPNVIISPAGNINYQGTLIGQIGVFKFEDNSVLKRAAGSAFVPTDDSNPTLFAEPEVIQNNLETSNVDMMKTTVQMTSNLRAFEAMQKALRIYSDMGSKAADIGLIQ